MSKKTERRFEIKTIYFNKLREISISTDYYVESFIKNNINISDELKIKSLKRYRFQKPKLRPAQVCFAYQLAGGNEWKKVVPLCGAIELKDTSYYCADDVFDQNEQSKENYIIGNILSVLANAMVNEIFDLSISKEQFQKIYKNLFVLDAHIYQGLYIDQKMKGTDEEYYMKKAYAYNYWEHILKIGALTVRDDDETINKIGEIGKNIGIAYTIANDTCDFGKERMEDFALGKYTLPIIFALKNANDKNKKVLNDLLGRGSFSEDEVSKIRKIFVESGAINYGKKRAWDFCEKALSIIEDFPNSEAKEMLKFSTTMTQRNKYYDKLKEYEL